MNIFSCKRLFLSAEPAPSAQYHIIPQGILESAIKITNEPPIGMWANLHKVKLHKPFDFEFPFQLGRLLNIVDYFAVSRQFQSRNA